MNQTAFTATALTLACAGFIASTLASSRATPTATPQATWLSRKSLWRLALLCASLLGVGALLQTLLGQHRFFAELSTLAAPLSPAPLALLQPQSLWFLGAGVVQCVAILAFAQRAPNTSRTLLLLGLIIAFLAPFGAKLAAFSYPLPTAGVALLAINVAAWSALLTLWLGQLLQSDSSRRPTYLWALVAVILTALAALVLAGPASLAYPGVYLQLYAGPHPATLQATTLLPDGSVHSSAVALLTAAPPVLMLAIVFTGLCYLLGALLAHYNRHSARLLLALASIGGLLCAIILAVVALQAQPEPLPPWLLAGLHGLPVQATVFTQPDIDPALLKPALADIAPAMLLLLMVSAIGLHLVHHLSEHSPTTTASDPPHLPCGLAPGLAWIALLSGLFGSFTVSGRWDFSDTHFAYLALAAMVIPGLLSGAGRPPRWWLCLCLCLAIAVFVAGCFSHRMMTLSSLIP